MRFLVMLAAWLPPQWVDTIGSALGWIWHTCVPIRRRVARANLQRALGTNNRATRRLVRHAYCHFGRSLAEAMRAAGGRPPPLVLVGEVHLREALAQGRGVLVLSAHLGNFEALVRAAGQFDVPVNVLTKRFTAEGAQRRWGALRDGGPRFLGAGSARQVLAALARGEIVADVLDQHAPPGRAVWVPFFGRPAATLPDLVRLARRSGAPVVPVFTHRRGGRHHVIAQPALPLSTDRLQAVAQCVAVVETAVRARPSQWLWIHRRWKQVPDDVAGALVRGHAPERRTIRATASKAGLQSDDPD